jgi:undecaprenyl-diphosphatase
MPIWEVVLLGLIEGITEFLPVSSTGHLLLTEHFLGICNPGKTFEVLIQLGALAFLPAVAVGAGAHDLIKGILYESPMLISEMLVVGGIILLIIDRMPLTVRYTDVMDYPPSLAFKIGLFQCLALVPGVSRSGATIVGAMLFGTDKRSAAEFTFFLAMPTMAGAFAYDLHKNWSILKPDDLTNAGLRRSPHRRRIRRTPPARLREPARFCAVRLVAHHRRRRRYRRALGVLGQSSACPA